MSEKYLYSSLLDNRINDGVRAFCRAEGLDERSFRCCVCQRHSIKNFLRNILRMQKRSEGRTGDFFISDAGLPW